MANNLTFTLCGGCCIPVIALFCIEAKPLGKYGRMPRNYLKEHRPILWNSMILSETPYPHLYEIDNAAHRRSVTIMNDMLRFSPVPNKAVQQTAWE